ncbi:MAG: GNAT family N-acetyltransferase [Alphaproteobacteria bacterium]
MSRIDVLSLDRSEDWRRYADRLPVANVVYHPSYTSIFEAYGDGRGECFVFSDGDDVVLYPYIIRSIDPALQAAAGLSGKVDIITPYGYGGFVHNLPDDARAAPLLARFRAAFDDHARSLGAVSEFIRFHPHMANHRHCEGLIDDVRLHEMNVILDLTKGKDELLAQCRPTHRRYIRRAQDGGLVLCQEPNTTAIDTFFDLYQRTMKKHNQVGYLNFRAGFFKILSEKLSDNLLTFTIRMDGEAMAGALFLVSGKYMDYFLGASHPANLTLHPNHFLFYQVACWGHDLGYEWLHLGGGSPTLMFFKGGFSRFREPYYTGRHLHDRDAYRTLSERHWASLGLSWDETSPYFPAYRYTP